MAKKKPQSSPGDNEERELEEKIKQMLDPRLPDPKEASESEIKVIKEEEPEDKVSELPDKIELVDESKDEKPEPVKTAPPVGKKITIKHFADDPDETDSKQAAESTDEADESMAPATAPLMADAGDEEADQKSEKTPSETANEKIDTQDEAETVDAVKESEATDDSPEKDADTEDEEVPEPVEDKELDKAVDDILAEESDKLLEQDDKSREQVVQKNKPSGGGLKRFFAAWWHSKLTRRITLLFLLIVLAGAAIIPTSRYFVLNAAGVRSSASLKVIDESTLQPLKNVKVSINGRSALTDNEGSATVQDLKLGQAKLSVEKRAFATVDQSVTIGWGSNPLGQAELKPVGTQYEFKVTDFVSGKPLHKIEAVSGDASAFSDEEGKILLTLDMPEDIFEVQLIGESLRTDTIEMDADDKSVRDVKMVPAKKHVYVSKRTGNYDVYAVYADGKEEEKLLEGTGSERDDLTLVPHPTEPIAALVATRSNERNEDGYLLSDLMLINVDEPGKTNEIAKSERIQIIGWQNERLVYVQIASGTSAANPERHRLKTYNINEGTNAELASANYFNDVMIAKDLVLYAPSSAYAKTPAALYRINPNGSDQQVVHPEEVWSMFRTGHNAITFTTGREWHEFSIDDRYSKQLSGEPSSLISRVYTDNPAKTTSLWIDHRDGKGALLVTNIEDGKDEVLYEQSGLKMPIYWLNDSTIVFRISTDTETADYVISLNGGDPKKLSDVTNTTGIDRWYYY